MLFCFFFYLCCRYLRLICVEGGMGVHAFAREKLSVTEEQRSVLALKDEVSDTNSEFVCLNFSFQWALCLCMLEAAGCI